MARAAEIKKEASLNMENIKPFIIPIMPKMPIIPMTSQSLQFIKPPLTISFFVPMLKTDDMRC